MHCRFMPSRPFADKRGRERVMELEEPKDPEEQADKDSPDSPEPPEEATKDELPESDGHEAEEAAEGDESESTAAEAEAETEPEAADTSEPAPAADEKPSKKSLKEIVAENKKAVFGGVFVIVAILVAVLAKYLIVPYSMYLDAKSKFDSAEYAAAAQTYGKIAGFMDSDELKATAEKADCYTRGASALAEGNYQDAIDCFTEAGDYQDAATQLENAKTQKTYAEAESQLAAGRYQTAGIAYASILGYGDAKDKAAQCADTLMGSEKYSEAKSIYDKLGSDYAEKSSQAQTAYDNKQNMDSAESKIKSGDFSSALELYNQISDDFTSGGINAGTRKQQLNNAIAVAGLAGTYNATGCNVSVTQTSRSTGSWSNWYNDGDGAKNMKVTIEASMADDGTVTFSGEVTFWRYTNYSSVGRLVKSTNVTKEFTCGANPGTIQLDDDTTLSYDGSWHIRYRMVDYSEDVYFYYTYVANFDYSK